MIDDGIGPQGDSFGNLAVGPDSRHHAGPGQLCHLDRHAPDSAPRPHDEHGLSMLKSGERKEHMRRGHRHERKRRRLFKRKVLRNRQHIAERHFEILRIAAVRLGSDQSIRAAQIVSPRQTLIAFPATDPRRHEHPLPHSDPFDVIADLLHDPGRIRPRHMRKRNRIGGIAFSYPNVEVVQRAGLDANQHLLRSNRRRRQILIGKCVQSAMRAKEYRLHETPSFQQSAFSYQLFSQDDQNVI